MGPSHVAAVLCALALTGCLLSGAPDDVSVVCERKSGSPWHPYAPEEVKARTLVEPGVPEEGVLAATRAVADSVLTLGGNPYERFEGHLFGSGAGTWTYDGNGTWGDALDRYQISFRESDGTLVRIDETVRAPPSLVALAHDAVEGDPEARALVGSEQPAGGTWSEREASCVRLQYGGAMATVNLVQRRVVHVA